ncbi:MAG TPA: HEAT repeat domain-containing protein [Chloroflexi bacterium]|nr:HEAT repeat domain-containing protein [Chloroflexota bacterium]
MGQDTESLLKDLKAPQWRVRQEAIRKLEYLGDTAAVPALMTALEDESQYVRMAAARALGKLGDPAAVPALVGALQDPMFIVRQNAMWALGEIGAGAKEALPVLEKLASEDTHFPEGELTVGELATLTIARINAALEPAKAEGEKTADTGEGRVLTPEERKAKREAALARKRARQAARKAEEEDAGGAG